MRSPFDDLGGPRLNNRKGIEITGFFVCEKCPGTVEQATEFEDGSMTYVCPLGHRNNIKGFEYNG
jgi:hypothetical protein